jgi:hypothetical protein
MTVSSSRTAVSIACSGPCSRQDEPRAGAVFTPQTGPSIKTLARHGNVLTEWFREPRLKGWRSSVSNRSLLLQYPSFEHSIQTKTGIAPILHFDMLIIDVDVEEHFSVGSKF